MIKDKLYSFLKKINWLIVGLLLIVCVTPQVYKEAFSEEGLSASRLFSSVLYTLPLCFLVASIKRKWAFVVLSAVLMMVSFFEIIMVVLYNNFVIAGNIIAALTTTADEGTGFVMSTLHALPWTLPVILLTARDTEFDRVRGLDAGADDYVAKPFSMLELISRIRAVLRRSSAASEDYQL